MDYYIIAFLWITWCFLHSFLITPSVTIYLQDKLQNKYDYFRLFYNVFATISFVLLWMYKPMYEETIVFSWDGYWHVIRLLLIVISLLSFILGTKNYDMLQFIGIRHIAEKSTTQGIGKSGGLILSGILQYVRHPWYFGIILYLWAGYEHLGVTRLIANSILTLYLIIGAKLEEKKIVAEFGDAYRDYQRKVPMLIPYKLFNK